MMLQNRLTIFEDNIPGSTEQWEVMKDGMKGEGKEVLGYQRKDRIGDHIWDLIKERKQIHQKHLTNSTNQSADYQMYITKDWEFRCSVQRQALLAGKAG